MNKFELISKTEYDKVVAEEFNAKNGVIGFQSYDQLQVPKRATKGSAGYDFISPISFKLKPGQTIKVPTCVKCCLSLGNVLMLFPRSSYGFKYRMQLDNTVGIVDQDYYNNDSKSGKTLEVKAGDAFAQGIIMAHAITDDDNVVATRTGGIGSTSNN